MNEIKGLDGILDKLHKLGPRLGRNAMRRALRKGAKPIRDAARNNARTIDDPETRAMIFKNITIAGGRKSDEAKDGGPKMRVGIMGGARFKRDAGTDLPGGNTTAWRFVEFGTSKMPAEPFMRPAAQSASGEAMSALIAAMQSETDKELAKL